MQWTEEQKKRLRRQTPPPRVTSVKRECEACGASFTLTAFSAEFRTKCYRCLPVLQNGGL